MTVTRIERLGAVSSEHARIDLAAIRKAVKPLLWRVLICPVQPKAESKGGIALPDSVQDGEEHLNYLGRVVTLGPLAGRSERYLNPRWDPRDDEEKDQPRYLWAVREGDWVTYGRYAGQRMEWRGIKLLAVNDDEILGVIESPDEFRVYAA